MAKYRKRALVVEAKQWTGDGQPPLAPNNLLARDASDSRYWWLQLPSGGNVKLCPGDWIVRGTRGEIYPIADDVFDEIYERVA